MHLEDLLRGARYFMGVLVVVSIPPAVAGWFIIHPFHRFWRRRGPVVTYSVVALVGVALGVGMYRLRGPLLAEPYPFNAWLAAVGVALYGVAIWLEILCRRHLKLRILVGLPEVGRDPGSLLTEGIYGRIRHPRYVSFTSGILGWVLILNYPGLYLLFLASLPALYLVVVLEERELRDRFGEEYLAYMERVPRFIPRR